MYHDSGPAEQMTVEMAGAETIHKAVSLTSHAGYLEIAHTAEPLHSHIYTISVEM